MKKFLLFSLAIVFTLLFINSVLAQGTISITKLPAYIPAPTVDNDSTAAPPFAIYVSFSGGSANSDYFLKVGSPSFNDITYQLYTYRNTGANAGTWGKSSGYNNDNFVFHTDASGKWEGWVPVKAHKSGITQISLRARLASGSNVNSPNYNVNMITAGSGAGYLVGNLLDGTGGTKDNKVVVAYNGSSIRGIWFSEVDSAYHVSSPLLLDELHTNYTTAMSFVNANGGYAMLVPSGTNAITKVEVYTYPNNTGSSTSVASEVITAKSQNITIPNAVPSSGNSSTVGIAPDITLDIKVPDGAGTAVLTNETAGTLNGSAIFARNAGSQSVKVSITGVSAGLLDTVRLTVPSDFTGFSGSNVTLGGAFSGKTKNVVGNQITIPDAALGTTTGTILITGLTSPNPVGALLNGNSTWKVETADSGGVLTEILSSPKSYTIIPISNIRTGGDDGYGNNLAGDTSKMSGQTVATAGVATIENGNLQATNANFVIQSGNYGVEVFRYGSWSTSFARGDSIIIKGTVTAYGGATEIIPASDASPDFFVIGAATLPAPKLLANASAVAESTECQLIRLNSATFDSAGQTFIALANNRGRNNFHTSTSDSGTIYLGASNPLVNRTIPVSADIIGIALHRKNYTGGGQTPYKVAPRDAIDLGMDPADGTGLASITPTNRFPSLFGVAETLVVKGNGIYTLAGVSVTIPYTWTWTNSSAYSISGAGFASSTAAVTGDGSSGNPYVITISNTAVTNTDTGIVIISSLNTPSALGITTFTVKTKGSTGELSAIASSPNVNIMGGFEAITTGNWNSGSTWSGGVVPGPNDDVTFTTKNVVVTITADAQCRNLTMVGTADTLGPMLQFATTGTITLTVNGRLDISGGTFGGNGSRGSRPKLTSNGNSNATLIAKSYVFTNVSNTSTNGDAGLNMNEGTVKLIGNTSDTLKTSAGFRLGNLIVGDGTNPKSVTWYQTGSGNMIIRSLTIKNNASLVLGGTSNSTQNSIGNFNTTGTPMLTGGVTIESGGSLIVNDASSANRYAHINIKNGGLTNNGTLNLISPNGSRKYYVSFGDLTADPTGSNQTVSGSSTGTYSFVRIGALDTVTLNQSMNVVDSLVLLNGELVETANHTIVGKIKTTRYVDKAVENKFGGIGLVVTAMDTVPGSTTIYRITGTAQTGSGYESIKRYFDISPTVNTGMNATLDFYYDESELNGQDEASLTLWKSTDNGTLWWIQSTTRNTGLNQLHTSGVNSLSRWSAADASHPLGGATKEYYMNMGWNMISLPILVADYRKNILYPTAISNAFYYDVSYKKTDTLKNGVGYWLKFAAAETVQIMGADITSDSIDVVEGWNLIGSIARPVRTSDITSQPADIVKSYYFGYSNSYFPTDSVRPGKGYWVKTSSAGKLYLNSTGLLSKTELSPVELVKQLQSLTVTDKNGYNQTLYFGSNADKNIDVTRYELPPVAPEGLDVRFASNRMVEVLPEKIENNKTLPISIKSSAYPITISWNVKDGSTYTLKDGASLKQSLIGEGKLVLSKPVSSLFIEVSNKGELPTEFSLSANYPNPFNPSTKFVLAVPKTAVVEVVVYDILGRKVKSLLNEEKSAGYHTIEWNGLTEENTSAPSGVYFVRMVSDKFSAVRKIMMMK